MGEEGFAERAFKALYDTHAGVLGPGRYQREGRDGLSMAIFGVSESFCMGAQYIIETPTKR